MKFVDESARKLFTANKDGVLFEFGHKQSDNQFWNGVKHYSSGKQSRIRFPRTQEPEGGKLKVKKTQAPRVAVLESRVSRDG